MKFLDTIALYVWILVTLVFGLCYLITHVALIGESIPALLTHLAVRRYEDVKVIWQLSWVLWVLWLLVQSLLGWLFGNRTKGEDCQEGKKRGEIIAFLKFAALGLFVVLVVVLLVFHHLISRHQMLLAATLGTGTVLLFFGLALSLDKTLATSEYPTTFFDARAHLRQGTVRFQHREHAFSGCMLLFMAFLLLAAGLFVAKYHNDSSLPPPPISTGSDN